MSDVKCHRCDRVYDCDLYEYQGLCPYCKSIEVIRSKPGSKHLDREGNVWVRMKDDINRHVESTVFNPETGEWKHGSRIIFKED